MRSRLTISLVAAFALHAGALAVVRVRNAHSESAAARAEHAEIDLDLAPIEPPASPEAPPSAVPPPSPEARTAMATSRPSAVGPEPAPSAPSDAPPSSAPPSEAPAANAVPATSSSAWSAWTLATRPGPDAPLDIGVGTSAVRERVVREGTGDAGGAGESQAAADSRRTTGLLRDALAAHDREIGLGRGGPVVQAARDATSGGLAPVNGHAMFEATFDTAGKVTAVRVLDVSSDERSWEEVATALKGALHDKTLKVPHDAKGLAVSVRVESRWQMPDGSDPDPPKICVPPFPCDAAPHRKKIVISPLGLGGSLPSGDKPLRVVHAYIVSERVL